MNVQNICTSPWLMAIYGNYIINNGYFDKNEIWLEGVLQRIHQGIKNITTLITTYISLYYYWLLLIGIVLLRIMYITTKIPDEEMIYACLR
jgi:hypothetical protein